MPGSFGYTGVPQEEDPVDSDKAAAEDLDGYEGETLVEHLEKHAASDAFRSK
jgi:hypothetical protein